MLQRLFAKKVDVCRASLVWDWQLDAALHDLPAASMNSASPHLGSADHSDLFSTKTITGTHICCTITLPITYQHSDSVCSQSMQTPIACQAAGIIQPATGSVAASWHYILLLTAMLHVTCPRTTFKQGCYCSSEMMPFGHTTTNYAKREYSCKTSWSSP